MKDKIIEILNERKDISLTAIEINDKLGLKSGEDYKLLCKTLNQMAHEGTLYYSERKDKYLLMENSHLIKGILELKSRGYAFLTETGLEKDVYISERDLKDAYDGDLVAVEITDKTKNEGKVIKVLKRSEKSYVGEIIKVKDKTMIKPDNKDLPLIPLGKKVGHNYIEGYKVLFQKHGINDVEIKRVLGHKDDYGIDELGSLLENDFDPDFNDEIKKELEFVPSEISEKDTFGRRDLRDKMIFTIDGADTKDIDDALSKENNVLSVHIADVSSCVKLGSAIFDRAYHNATSVYTPGHSIPMLPRELSNGICSLNPEVDRLAISCDMTVDEIGKIIDYDIYLSVIRSRKKMTYDAVNSILEDNIVPEGYEDYADTLREMDSLAKKVHKLMIKRGYVEFDRPEIKVIMDEKTNKPVDVKARTQRSGEKLIEVFMIMANETVLNYLTNTLGMGIYRVHPEPDVDKIESLFGFLALKGAQVRDKADKKAISPRSLNEVISQLQEDPALNVIKDLMIRSMAKAFYSPDNIGHYGLGSRCYGHFTSPIRRLPDLIIHMLIKLSLSEYDEEELRKWELSLEDFARQASKKERDADIVEREVTKMRVAEYMENHIGEIYKGVISSITEFGMFVELPNLVEGLVKIEDIPGDYFNYIPELYAMVGAKTKKRYMLGDTITVKVKGASKERSEVDFEIVKEDKKDEKEKEGKKKVKNR